MFTFRRGEVCWTTLSPLVLLSSSFLSNSRCRTELGIQNLSVFCEWDLGKVVTSLGWPWIANTSAIFSRSIREGACNHRFFGYWHQLHKLKHLKRTAFFVPFLFWMILSAAHRISGVLGLPGYYTPRKKPRKVPKQLVSIISYMSDKSPFNWDFGSRARFQYRVGQSLGLCTAESMYYSPVLWGPSFPDWPAWRWGEQSLSAFSAEHSAGN